MYSQAIHDGRGFASPAMPRVGASGEDALELLNGAAFTPAQIEGALRALGALPAALQPDPRAQALALQAYAAEEGLSSAPKTAAALHARVTALAKWTAAHDPMRQSDAEAVLAATARFPLAELPNGIGFDPAGFQELVLFIEELPW